MAYFCVYLVTNTVNGKVYVGKTQQPLSARWGQHVSAAKSGRNHMPILRAIRKYGPKAFTLTELEVCYSLEKLNAAEKQWISTLRSTTTGVGYNCTSGGDGDYNHTPEYRARLSVSCSIAGKKHYREHPERAKHHAAVMKARSKTSEGQRQLKEAGKQAWVKRIAERGNWVSEDILREVIQGMTIQEYCKKKKTLTSNYPRSSDCLKLYGKTFQEIRDGVRRGNWVAEDTLRQLIVGGGVPGLDRRHCLTGMSTLEYSRLKTIKELDSRYPPIRNMVKVYGKTFKEIREGVPDSRWKGRR